MTLVKALRANGRLTTVLVFVLACAVGFGVLWVKAGGTVPLVAEARDYRVDFNAKDIKNLRVHSDVRIAGVVVGRVESRELTSDGVNVELSLDPDVAPLHEGATVRVGVKSLVGSSYVDVKDGDGPAISSGADLPRADVVPAVDVDELLNTLDPKTRKALSGTVQALYQSTRGTGTDLDRLMTGLGHVGREGYTVLDALSAQNQDLAALTVETRQLLDALDEGQGQIVDLVDDAQSLTGVTAEKRAQVEELVRKLPGLVRNVGAGAVSLKQLAGPLAPILASLRQASPDLTRALVNLPAVTADLHGLLPSLDGTLDRAPRTLDRLPDFATALSDLVPDADTTLRDVDPMLAYLAPYGLDLGVLFGSFGGSFDTLAEDGIRPIRLTATGEGLGTVRGIPAKLPQTGLWWNNPYPAPGTVDQPQPYRGPYPRIHRAP
ncbi:MAG TPA: MlaD family protein [Nocardioides sp.]|nr:MlaD family protein [Nocardioides sp.]